MNQTVEPSHAPEATGVNPTPNEPSIPFSDFNPTFRQSPSTHEASVTGTGHPITATSGSTQTTHNDTQAPAAKRRRLDKNQEKGPAPPFSTSDVDANVPLPTTETNEVVAEASNTAEAGAASNQPPQAVGNRLTAQEKRKKQIEDAAAEVVADVTQDRSAKTKKPRHNAKGKDSEATQPIAAETSAGSIGQSSGMAGQNAAAPKAKRKYTKRKSKQKAENAAAEIVDDAIQGSSNDRTQCGRRSRRAVTPEGAESVMISTSEVKMSDLCKDGRTGRRSDLEKQIDEFERAEFIRKKQRQLQEVMGQAASNRATPAESTNSQREREERQRREESVAQNVPNTVIVNGQIRIDEDSLQIDRHAAAAVERAQDQLEAVDETSLTRKINSATWLKRDKSGGWNALLTERFYDGLRMFGTDFEMISKMFPGRTRHKIKLKFIKEEKVNYNKIKATLLGQPLPVDLLEFEKMAGTEFDDPEELEKDIEEDRRRLEDETAAEKQAMVDAKREREVQIAAERTAAIGEESSAKENRGRRARRKKGEKREKRKKRESKKKEKHVKRKGPAGGNIASGRLVEAVGVVNQA